MSNKNLIGERIKELRKKNKETQEDLAHAINYNQSTICKLEKGQRLSADQQLKIAEHYGVSPASLCFGVDNNILDILTQYIKIDYVTTKDYQSTYPVLNINSALVNYLLTVDLAKSAFRATDYHKALLNEQEDLFYEEIEKNDGTLKDLSIPLTKEVIFPDEYQKEWEKIINLRSALPNKHP